MKNVNKNHVVECLLNAIEANPKLTLAQACVALTEAHIVRPQGKPWTPPTLASLLWSMSTNLGELKQGPPSWYRTPEQRTSDIGLEETSLLREKVASIFNDWLNQLKRPECDWVARRARRRWHNYNDDKLPRSQRKIEVTYEEAAYVLNAAGLLSPRQQSWSDYNLNLWCKRNGLDLTVPTQLEESRAIEFGVGSHIPYERLLFTRLALMDFTHIHVAYDPDEYARVRARA
jgi:hypothetical protein